MKAKLVSLIMALSIIGFAGSLTSCEKTDPKAEREEARRKAFEDLKRKNKEDEATKKRLEEAQKKQDEKYRQKEIELKKVWVRKMVEEYIAYGDMRRKFPFPDKCWWCDHHHAKKAKCDDGGCSHTEAGAREHLSDHKYRKEMYQNKEVTDKNAEETGQKFLNDEKETWGEIARWVDTLKKHRLEKEKNLKLWQETGNDEYLHECSCSGGFDINI